MTDMLDRTKELALAMHAASKKMKPTLPEVRAALEILYGITLGLERNLPNGNVNGAVKLALEGLEAQLLRWRKENEPQVEND